MKTLLASLLLSTFAGLLPAQGYEWDHPDGIGVRYLLYKKMKKLDVAPEHQGPDVRLAYTPTDQDDWVRVKGYPLDWGVLVYEFGVEGNGDGTAVSFEDFLQHKDPYLKSYRRDITVHGRETGDTAVRLWEYRDWFVPLTYILDRSAPGGFVWAESDQLQIRFPVKKGMVSWNADEKTQKSAGPNLRSRLVPRKEDRVRIKGYKRPLSWQLFVYEFPASAERQDSALWASTFEELVTRREPQSKRSFTERDQQKKGKNLPFHRWQWTDDKRKADGRGYVEHHIAAVYDLPGRQIGLVMQYPAVNEKPDRKLHKLGTTIVSRLAPAPDARPGDEVGRQNLQLAASCYLEGVEVAVVVSIPVETGGAPDPAVRARAEKIVRSLQPK